MDMWELKPCFVLAEDCICSEKEKTAALCQLKQGCTVGGFLLSMIGDVPCGDMTGTLLLQRTLIQFSVPHGGSLIPS